MRHHHPRLHALHSPPDHKDIEISAPSDGEVLTYEAVTEKWKNKVGAGATHNLLSATHPDTLADSVLSGDIIIGNATPKWARLPKDVDGKFLKLVAGLPAWSDPPAVTDHNLLSGTHPDTLAGTVVRGDVIVGNATPKWARLALGLSQRYLRSDGLDALWALIDHAEIGNVLPNQHHARLHSLSDVLDHSGILTGSMGGLQKALVPTWTNDYIPVYKTATDDWRMEAKPTGAAPDPEDNVDLIDDFIMGSTESGEIGELGWVSVGTGTIIVINAPDVNHPGIYRVPTGATSGNSLAIMAFNAMTSLPFLFGMDSLEVTFIVRFQQSTALLYRLGFHINMGATANEACAIFEFDPVYGPDTNIMCVTASGTARTRTDSGVAFAVDTWFKFKIKRNAAGNWEFYINDVLRATNTTNLPPNASGTNVGAFAKTTEAVSKSFEVDFCRIKVTVAR